MKAILAIIILLPGCSYYSEQFTFTKETGHTVNVTHVSMFQMGAAGRLTTSTQTEEFIRDVNATDISVRPDGAALGEALKLLP
jgi:hypothetical protein